MMIAVNAVLFFVIMWIVYNPNLAALVTVLCMIIKFNISATFVLSYMQVGIVSIINLYHSVKVIDKISKSHSKVEFICFCLERPLKSFQHAYANVELV